MSCNRNNLVEKIKLNVKQEFSYLSDEDIDKTFDMALSDYLMIKYPSDNKRPLKSEIVIDFIISQWIYKRMVDILSRAGGLNVTSYKENGLSWTYAGSNIDPILVSEILPKVGVPR